MSNKPARCNACGLQESANDKWGHTVAHGRGAWQGKRYWCGFVCKFQVLKALMREAESQVAMCSKTDPNPCPECVQRLATS